MPLGTHWLEDIGGPATLEAVGWVVIDNPEFITICMDQNPESNGLRFILSIPKCAILEIRDVVCSLIRSKYDSKGTTVPSKQVDNES